MPSWTVRLFSEAPNTRESASQVIAVLEQWGSWVEDSDGGLDYTFVNISTGSTTVDSLNNSIDSITDLLDEYFLSILSPTPEDKDVSISIPFDTSSGLPLMIRFGSNERNDSYPFEVSINVPKGRFRNGEDFEELVNLITDIYTGGQFEYAKLHRVESEHLVSDQQDAIRSPLTAFQILSLGTVYELGIDELSVLDFERTERLPDDSILLLVERSPTESSSKIRELNESLGLE